MVGQFDFETHIVNAVAHLISPMGDGCLDSPVYATRDGKSSGFRCVKGGRPPKNGWIGLDNARTIEYNGTVAVTFPLREMAMKTQAFRALKKLVRKGGLWNKLFVQNGKGQAVCRLVHLPLMLSSGDGPRYIVHGKVCRCQAMRVPHESGTFYPDGTRRMEYAGMAYIPVH